MGSEKTRTDVAALVTGAKDVDALLKADWARKKAEPIPSSLIEHVTDLAAAKLDDTDDQTP